jgi:hypothetical protein
MMRPKIIGVQPKENRKVHVLIQRGGIFLMLNDDVIFFERCTVMNGTLAWDLSGRRNAEECIDICPDTIYDTCPNVKYDQIS